jgi:hypothetical protein
MVTHAYYLNYAGGIDKRILALGKMHKTISEK